MVLIILGSVMTLAACFFRDEKPVVMPTSGTLVKPVEPKSVTLRNSKQNAIGQPGSVSKDKSLNLIAHYFEKADAIHREAWWVLSSERRPVGKSPFGKIQRALLASQNIKLSNKSMFRCDRYIVKRDVMKLEGFPQRAEVFEKCSMKTEAKKIGQFFAPHANEIQVVFLPENLEEILGLGATVINKAIQCTLRGNDREQLVSLKCQDWAQERSKEHMIRLDVYEYQMAGRNLIKLRGKVYENLSEARKIVADVPVDGKIFVTETEMYPPEEIPDPQPAKPAGAPASTVGISANPVVPVVPVVSVSPVPVTPLPIPPPRQLMDPDVLEQQRQQLEQHQMDQAQPSMLQQVPLQHWNPNEGVAQPQEAVESDGQQDLQEPSQGPQDVSQPENINQENPTSETPIPAGGVYGR